MNAVILGYEGRTSVPETVEKLLPELRKHLNIVAIDLTGKQDLSEHTADMAIVFGGDGSVLRSIHQLGSRQVPLLAVNVGTLAFLSSLMPQELIPFLTSPGFSLENTRHHILLECTLLRKQPSGSSTVEVPIARKMVVNEVVIQSGPPFTILKVQLAVDGVPVATYHGDGLILSTPTGSTAHNLSSGGPILRRDLDAVVVSPISPHSLSYRPVVDSANRTYELNVVNRSAYIVVDGDSDLIIEPGDRLVIRKMPFTARMIRTPGKNYYNTLREKLGWSGMVPGV